MTIAPPPAPPPPAGPPIEVLTRRLAETPADFLAPPALAQGDPGPQVAAVVSDLLVDLGHPPLRSDEVGPLRPGPADDAYRSRLGTVLVAAWLLADPWFVAARPDRTAVLATVGALLHLDTDASATTVVADVDRREELARRTLATLGLVPAGETAAQAADRLATLDSVERARVLAATAEAERRAAAVRQAMHEKAAAEAAAKASRE
jgi:hypothetical protein